MPKKMEGDERWGDGQKEKREGENEQFSNR